MERPSNDFLAKLVGSPLTEVEVIGPDGEAALYLGFGRPTPAGLSVEIRTEIRVDGRTMGWKDPGFKNSLESLVGLTLVSARSEPQVAITLAFEGGVELVISLKEEDFTGPEAAILIFSDGGPWIVWQGAADEF